MTVNKLMRKGSPNRAWFIMMRNVAEHHLWRNILVCKLSRILGNINPNPLEHWIVLMPGYLGRVLHRRIHM